MRGKGIGRLRSETRAAAKRAAGIGGVDAADLVLRTGRELRRVVLVLAVVRWELLAAEGLSADADCSA